MENNGSQNLEEFPELTNRSTSMENFTITTDNAQCHHVPAPISMVERIRGSSFSANVVALADNSSKSNKIPARATRRFRPYPGIRPQFSQFRRPIPINNFFAKLKNSCTI